jgi:ADP-ribose pyrophosphatase YjhB (NUDIX family)
MSQAKSLGSFPRPHVAVDLAVLTVIPGLTTGEGVGELNLLVLEPSPGRRHRALPGRFIRERRTVTETIEEIIREKLAITSGFRVAPKLLGVFDSPTRDDRGWTISLAHAVALPHHNLAAGLGDLVPVRADTRLATREHLDYDHDAIVAAAVRRMREHYEHAPDPYRLLEGPFTLSDLRRLHEAVLGARLARDTFKRRMVPHLDEVKEPTGEPSLRRAVGRPTQLFKRAKRARSGAVPAALQLPRTTAGRHTSSTDGR